MLDPSRSFEPAEVGLVLPPTRRRLAALLLAGVGLLTLSPFERVSAQSRLLDAPRAAGTVGERYDGFAMVRGEPSPEIATLVAKVNAERRAVYAQRAASDKITVEAVGKIYALEIMKSAPPKAWFLSESGQWAQK